MRWDFVILVLLLGVLAILGFLLYDSWPKEARLFSFTKTGGNLSELGNFSSYYFPEGIQFYPNMRYAILPITYSFEDNCNTVRIQGMERAITILEEKTTLSFSKSAAGQIVVSCSEVPKQIEKKLFIAGEGGPTYIVNTTLYHVIYNGSVFLYKTDQCDEPLVELHELLHALGFQHSTNKNSIMYPTSNCNQKLTQDIIDEINRLYTIEGLADLFFNDLWAQKRGRYIDFEIQIKNRGLVYSIPVNISIYADDEKISFYNISTIAAGNVLIMKVGNLRGPRSFDSLRFIIDEENIMRELYEQNNIAIMVVE